MLKVIATGCVVAVTLSACTASQSGTGASASNEEGVATAHAVESGMTCSQAVDLGRATLIKMGYTIATVESAKPNAPGKVVGHKTTGWSAATPEPGQDANVYVRIACSDQGAVFDAVTNEGLLSRMGFRQRFASIITALATERPRRSGSDHGSQQGMIVDVEPQRGSEARAQFGIDLPAAGITPVQLKLDNKSQRTYGFTSESVRLVTEEGTHVSALSLQEAAGKAGADALAQLQQKQISDGDVAPGASRNGFLYFPSSAYRRATVTLVDRSSDESEGFSVEF